MSQPALYTLVRDGRALFYVDKWGGESAEDLLLSGPAAEQHMITHSRIAPDGLEELDLESAFLIDFDRRVAIATPADDASAESRDALLKQAGAQWEGEWSLGFGGVPEFLEHLRAHEIELLGPPQPS